MTSRERHRVSNHCQWDCVLKSLFRLNTRKYKTCTLMAQWEESISDCWIPIPKGQPLMRIWFGCHDIITSLGQMYQPLHFSLCPYIRHMVNLYTMSPVVCYILHVLIVLSCRNRWFKECNEKLRKSCFRCKKNTWDIESSHMLQHPKYLIIIVNGFRYKSNSVTKIGEPYLWIWTFCTINSACWIP